MHLLFQRVASRIEAERVALRDPHATRLCSRGWALVEGVERREDCEQLLEGLGPLLTQYGGVLRHEVAFRPGYDDLQYSQSANAISPHTEAPGQDPPPRYLALHCHRAARCGGGHTLLADGYELIAALPAGIRHQAETRPIRFDLAGGGEASPLVAEHGDGTPILRFSYNVMRNGCLEGPARDHEDLTGVDPFLAELCRRGVELTRERGVRVLAPDASLLIFDNWRMLHSRQRFDDRDRHLTRYWVGA